MPTRNHHNPSRPWLSGGVAVVVGLAAIVAAYTYASAGISGERVKRHVRALASESFGGRAAGTRGHDRARDYIADYFEKIGLEPAGTDGYMMGLDVVSSVQTSDDNSLTIGDRVLAIGHGFMPTGFSDDATFDDEPFFVGYGLSAPEVGYDDYRGLDVRDEIVVAFTGAPEDIEEKLGPESTYLLTTESKAAVALAHGARALILVNDPVSHGDSTDQRPDRLPEIRPAFALEGIAVARVTSKAASRAFTDEDVDLRDRQRRIDEAGKPDSERFGVEIAGELEVNREITTVSNVVGRVPGGAQSEDAKPLILGAHYDHLGLGAAGTLYEGADALHPGADDNASGVAVLLEVARSFAREKSLRRPVYFAAIAAEELGLRGSRRLAHHFAAEGAVGTYVNMDMVGRLREPGLRVLGLAENPDFARAVQSAAKDAELEIEERPILDSPSDHLAFSDAGFSVLSLTTGRHSDYHMPTDTIDKLNWEGLKNVALFVRQLLLTLGS